MNSQTITKKLEATISSISKENSVQYSQSARYFF